MNITILEILNIIGKRSVRVLLKDVHQIVAQRLREMIVIVLVVIAMWTL